MKNKIAILFCFLVSFSFYVKAQQGKDGVANISATNTVVNIYTPLTVSVTAGSSNITVASAAGFSAGDLIYIIQMQGATVNGHVYIWGDPNASVPADTSSGKVNVYNNTGNNEFAEIKSIAGNVITLDCILKNEYGDSLGGVPKTQVIRVPRYSSLTISSPGSITCPAWNGTTGGVVAIEVKGATTIGAGASIDVSGKGFRGGSILNATGFSVLNQGTFYGSPGSNGGGHKGESIVGDTNVYKRETSGNFDGNNYLSSPLPLCKANVANGGGGGNANNCGGGGGANGGAVNLWNGMGNPDNSGTNATSWSRESAAPVNGSFRPTSSSGGGRGGYAYSSINADPTLSGNGPNSVGVWGGDGRHNDGGWGGTPLDYSGGKIFLGGGGGAGDSNDGNGTAGANGGGIVYLLSYGTVSGAGQILADGSAAANTNFASSTFDEALALGDDGAGGGGGGGAVFINSVGAITLTNTVTPISAKGGKGGNYTSKNTGSTSKNFGPGGGGGGGYVATSNAVTSDVSGGLNGTVTLGGGNNTKIAQNFKPNGATAGGAGTATTTTTFYLTAPNYTICAGSSATLSVTANGTGIPGSITYDWYNTSTGGSSIFTGNPYNTGALTVGTYTYYAGTCPGTYRLPVIVNVLGAPTVTITPSNTVVCANSSVTFTASGASSYTWSANAGSVTTATATATPTIATTYTVTGANGTCTDTKTITINTSASPTVSIAASNTLVCVNSAVTFTASGASSYTWSANAGSATTSTVTVNPSANTTYTVTGVSGTCAPVTQTITVNTSASPTISIVASNTLVCANSPVTFTASGAGSYTWSANAGSVTTSTTTVNPSANTTYTVTGVSGTCPASTQTITVNTTPSPTISIVASSTFVCAGSAVTFTASGGSSYTWSANAGSVTTSTATVNPSSTTIYTVTGVNGTCPPVDQTITVNTTSSPTISIAASNTIVCANSAVTFTASGATSYTWSANAGSVTTDTTTVNPSSNTTYTVTGESGICPAVNQTITVTTSASPTISIAASNTLVCENSVVTLTASGASSYTWSANAGGVNTATATANPSSNTTYSVTGVSGTCPPFTQTITVNTVAHPTVTIVASTSTVCSGSPVTFTASGAATYTWSANAGSATTNTVSVSPTATDTYVVTGDNGGTCTSTQTVSINVTPTPTVTIVASNTAICIGGPVTFTANGATTYTWSANAASVTTATVVASPTITTTYTVTGENAGCTQTQTVSVIVNSLPNASASTTGTISCGGGTAIVNGNSTTASVTYTWTGPGIVSGASTSTATVNLQGIYTVTVTDPSTGCKDTATTSVTTDTAVPNATASTTGTLTCANNTAMINGNSTTSGVTYSWSGPGGYSSTAQNNTVSVGGTYTLTITNAGGGCSNVAMTVVAADTATPNISASATGTISCSGPSTATVSGNSTTGGVTYNWNGPGIVSGGSTATATINASGVYTLTVTNPTNRCVNTTTVSPVNATGPTNANINHLAADTCNRSIGSISITNIVGGTPGYHYSLNGGPSQSSNIFTGLASGHYQVLVTDTNGCMWTRLDSVNAFGPTPPVITHNDTTFCQGGSVTLSSNSLTGNNWSTGATTQTITVNVTDTVSLSVTLSGCTLNSNTVLVTVNPNPMITVNSPTICSGTSATLTASGATNYTWSANAGSATTSSVSVSSTTGTITSTIVYSVTGTYSTGCSGSNTSTVTVSPTPLTPIVNNTLFYCLFQNVTALTATASTGATVNWFDSNMNPLPGAPTPVTNPTGTTTYYVTQSILSCSSSGKDSIVVTVIPGPNADFVTNPTTDNILAGQGVLFKPNQGLSASLTYFWHFDDTNSNVDSSFSYSPTHAYADQGTYCPSLMVAQPLTGCSDTKTNCIKVLEGIKVTIPNVFTPNQDDINDVFSVKTEGISDLTCNIYDRWGIKLYEWTGIAGFWNGTDSKNGKTVSDGTYYYIIEATDVKKQNHKYQGYLQLLR